MQQVLHQHPVRLLQSQLYMRLCVNFSSGGTARPTPRLLLTRCGANMANKSGGNGIGLFTVLFCIFLVLKLTGHIAWSWWWVFGPLWIPITFLIIVFGVVAIITR